MFGKTTTNTFLGEDETMTDDNSTDVDMATESSNMDTNECNWEYEHDDFYYGDIPPCISIGDLELKMARGLYKLYNISRHHAQNCKDMNCEARNPIEIINNTVRILDRWFEHDANNTNRFNYMVCEGDEFDEFVQKVKVNLTNLIQGSMSWNF